jgi:hypothetical protein
VAVRVVGVVVVKVVVSVETNVEVCTSVVVVMLMDVT